jgi:hydrogenase 3 maturation protease
MKHKWEQNLKTFLNGTKKLSVLGVGSLLRGDDGAGMHVVSLLERYKRRNKKFSTLELFFGETAPENFTGEIRKANTEKLLIIDAVYNPGNPEGISFLLPDDDSLGFSASTHRMPFKVLCSYLTQSIGCPIGIIGISVESCEFGKTISQKVKKSCRRIAEAIVQSDS